MHALVILLDLRRVANGAVDRGELFGVGKIRSPGEVLVAVDAGRAGGSVHGIAEHLLVHENGGPVRPLGGRVLVASEAVVVGGRLRGRGRRPEGGGREQKRGEYAPEPHPH